MDKVQPLRSHQEELPPRRKVPQNEPVLEAIGTVQLRVELGNEMYVLAILKMNYHKDFDFMTYFSPRPKSRGIHQRRVRGLLLPELI